MATECLLRVTNLSMSFPGAQALQDVHLDIHQGQVHAVMGENGAGKSTLMKILGGLLTPHSGQIFLHGRPVELRNPHEALRRAICMIHQELQPFPDMSVAENVFMGQEPVSGPLRWLDRGAMHREARALLERLGVTVSPTARMGDLSVSEMQTVEIARVLACKAEVLIMDEPTSALSEREVTRLFEVIRDLKKRGVAVIYISHKLDEVFRIADRVTVLRDGRYVATHDTAELDAAKLIALMVGREVNGGRRQSAGKPGGVALAVRALSRMGRFHNVSFEVGRGEILGLAGLMGAGRTELLNAIFGLAPADAGEIEVQGRAVRIKCPRHAMSHGLALVTEDRKESGLVLTMSVRHNLTLSNLRSCSRGPFLDQQVESRIASGQIKAFSIKASDPDQPVNFLSGGNQQKVVIAKALLTEPRILLLDEPTRGIDVAAKEEVYAIIRRLAGEGMAIVMASSELPEILSLSDRILVLRAGTVAAELDAVRTSQEEIMKYAMPH